MLVISRRIGGKIRIGDDIVLTVTDIVRGSKVRIGIDAPKDVPIFRSELLPKEEPLCPSPPTLSTDDRTNA